MTKAILAGRLMFLCSRGPAPVTVHQKSIPATNIVRCSRSCTKSLRSAALYMAGSCQPMMKTIMRNHTAAGPVALRRPRPMSDSLLSTRLSASPATSRARAGKPHSKKGIGLGSSNSTGAMLINSRCWIMCMKNNCCTSTSSGDMRAKPMTSSPAM